MDGLFPSDAVAVNPEEARRRFIKLFLQIGHHKSRWEVLDTFLDLATLAIRKGTVPPAEADLIEQRYMEVVKRNNADDVRKMPELLALTLIGLADGHDFIGGIANDPDLNLLDRRHGQIFSPWSICEMMARMLMSQQGISKAIEEKGFITLCEPAVGAGAMVLAAAKVMREEGFDPGKHLFVDATDINPTAFKMCYLQLALAGIPALVKRGNSLSLETWERARTPAFFPFYAANHEQFDAWAREDVHTPEQPAPVAVVTPPARGRATRESLQGSMF